MMFHIDKYLDFKFQVDLNILELASYAVNWTNRQDHCSIFFLRKNLTLALYFSHFYYIYIAALFSPPYHHSKFRSPFTQVGILNFKILKILRKNLIRST